MSQGPPEPGVTRLGPYTLLQKLGQGGMGEVHLARDSRLNRKVAIKILPEELRSDPERRARFLREARAVAQLSHPNITQIFDVGESDGRDYIAFELVEGRTLHECIAQGPLSSGDWVELALPLADAIAYAHERGIVHRDLKSNNVMVTSRGHPKLLDFGLAKILHGGSQLPRDLTNSALTIPGSIFGTPAAMSPEQALGKPVDARSDIFSFGSLLYEMAAGHPAFRGATVMEVMHAVIHREPAPLDRVRSDLPPQLIACVAKALRKEPSERYQTMHDLAVDLRRLRHMTDGGAVLRERARRVAVPMLALVALGGLGWIGWRVSRSSATETTRHSLAVLPFTSLGTTVDDATFSAGLHSDVLTRLSKMSSLRVIARNSVLEYATTSKSLREIGAELGVGAILTGEVQRAGDALRFNLTLHDAANDGNLWAETYDRELSSKDIFAVQSDIAEAIARALQTQLSPRDKQELRAVPTTNDEAYDAYLIGQALFDGTKAEQQRSIGVLESAVALDPNFALAFASLSQARSTYYWVYDPSDGKLLESAFEVARRALALDPDLFEGHLSLGLCHYVSRDYEAAEREFEIAARGMPASAELLRARGRLHRRIGKWKEGAENLTRALELSPRDEGIRGELAVTLLFLGEFDEAARHFALQEALGGKHNKAFAVLCQVNRDGRVAAESLERSLHSKTAYTDEDFILHWRVCILSRDFAGARAQVDGFPELLSSQWYDYPRALLYAITDELSGDAARAHHEYEEARNAALAEIQARPDDARPHAALALALAGLGQRDEALTEARRATEMLPIERDSIVGSTLLLDRFYTELRVGALEDAVRTLDRYLAHEAVFSLRALVLDPRLDALEGHSGFEELRKRKEAR